MTKSEMIHALKEYKKLKDFFKNNFEDDYYGKVDHFDIENGEVNIYHYLGREEYTDRMTYNVEGILNSKIYEKLEEDIPF